MATYAIKNKTHYLLFVTNKTNKILITGINNNATLYVKSICQIHFIVKKDPKNKD